MDIIVSFSSEKVKKKYMRTDAIKHSWRSKFYAVLHIASYSESSIAHFMLVNDDGESWFVDTRDVLIQNPEEFSSNEE